MLDSWRVTVRGVHASLAVSVSSRVQSTATAAAVNAAGTANAAAATAAAAAAAESVRGGTAADLARRKMVAAGGRGAVKNTKPKTLNLKP